MKVYNKHSKIKNYGGFLFVKEDISIQKPNCKNTPKLKQTFLILQKPT